MLLGVISSIWIWALHGQDHFATFLTVSDYGNNTGVDASNSSTPCEDYSMPTDTVFYTTDKEIYQLLKESDCAC